MHSVCICVKFQANPKETHLVLVKRILKYIKDTLKVRFWYPKGASISLVRYSNSNYARCKVDRKSTSRTCHLLSSALVFWHSKKQVCMALSTSEAEYLVVGSCCAKIPWMKQQIEDFGIFHDHIPLRCDNTSAINLTKNHVMHSRTKYIEIKHHFLRVLLLDVKMIKYVIILHLNFNLI